MADASLQINPWDQNSSMAQNPNEAMQALLGAKQAVAQGQIDPEEAHARLKSFGAVPPDSQVEDIFPEREPAAAKPIAKGQRNLTNPSGSDVNTPSMNQTAAGAKPSAIPFGPALPPEMINPWSQNEGSPPSPSPFGRMMKESSGTSNSDTAVDKIQRQASYQIAPDQDVLMQKRLAAQGGKLIPQTDENGEPLYKQATDLASGRPLWINPNDPKAKPSTEKANGYVPVKDLNRPIFDYSKTVFDPNDPYQQQLHSLGDMQNMLAMNAKIEAEQPTLSRVNWAPLVNIGNSMIPEKERISQQGVTAPNPDEVRQTLMGYQAQLQKGRSDLSKDLFQNLRTQGTGGTLQDLAMYQNMQNQKANENQSIQEGNLQAQMQQQKNDWLAHNQVVRAIKMNPLVRNQLGGLFALGNSQGVLQGNELNKNSFAEAQNLSRIGAQTAANIKSTGDERSSTYMQNLSNQIQGWLDNYVAGGNLKIPQSDPQVQHFIKLNQDLIDYANQYKNQTMDFLSGGQGRIYNRGTPESDQMRQDLESLVRSGKAVGSTASNPGGMKTPKSKSVQNSGFKVGDIQVKNGVKYQRAADGKWDQVE